MGTKKLEAGGYTLVEVAVVLAILAVLGATFCVIVSSTFRFSAFANGRNEVVERSRALVDDLESDLLMARVLELRQGGAGTEPAIVYVLPVDIGEDANDNGVLDAGEDENGNGILDDGSDGDVTSAAGEIEWGCIESDGARLDLPGAQHRITLTFTEERTVSEAGEDRDMNGDGDTSDTFALGTITRTTTGGSTRIYAARSVLLGADDRRSDRDGDGVNDPLFATGGETFTDSNGNGVWNIGEPLVDANGNGVWDGVWRFNLSLFVTDAYGTGHALQVIRERRPRNPQE